MALQKVCLTFFDWPLDLVSTAKLSSKGRVVRVFTGPLCTTGTASRGHLNHWHLIRAAMATPMAISRTIHLPLCRWSLTVFKCLARGLRGATEGHRLSLTLLRLRQGKVAHTWHKENVNISQAFQPSITLACTIAQNKYLSYIINYHKWLWYPGMEGLESLMSISHKQLSSYYIYGNQHSQGVKCSYGTG